MKTAEEPKDPGLSFILMKIRMLDEDEAYDVMEAYVKKQAKDEITKFQDFLLKHGYCDVDVYAEPPTAIDRYFNPKLR